jgi:hypothetical protein
MSWLLWAWERIMHLTLVNRWIGRNVITALGAFTLVVFSLALALVFRDWGFSQTQRFILTFTAFILIGSSVVAGIALVLLPGDPLNLGRVFGTHLAPRTRNEARSPTTMSIAPQLPYPSHPTGKQTWIYIVTYTLQPWLLRDTSAIDRELQRLPNWSHWINNTWLIATNEVADVLYTRLRGSFLDTDRLLIAPLDAQSEFAGWLPQQAWDWIEEHRHT